jgi:pimeloyl-ACP methyl ester carboxylesterase
MQDPILTKSIELDGYRLAWRELGQGEPLLLVHGITTWSFIWEALMPVLARRYRVLALDLLGCGDSSKPLDQSYALKDHAPRIKRFIDALGLGPLHYVGHDLGGGIGQIMAVRYPGLFLDLCLVNSVAYDFWPVQPIIAMRTPIVRELAMASLDLGSFRLIIKRALYHKELLTDELLQKFRKPLSTEEGRKAFLHFAHCLNNRDLMEIEDELRTLATPVLVVRGQVDPYLSAAISERLVRELPHARLLLVPTGGHYLMLDEPELLAKELLAFIGEARA